MTTEKRKNNKKITMGNKIGTISLIRVTFTLLLFEDMSFISAKIPKTLENANNKVPITKEVKRTFQVMIEVEIKTISVMNNDSSENAKGINSLAKICFKGETGMVFTTIKLFPSLVMEREAEALITPTKRRTKVKLIPLTSSGK